MESRYVEVRLQDDPKGGPGVLSGVLMPYEQRATDRPEMFSRGALSWDSGGVVLNEMHRRDSPIMRFVPRDTGSELRVEIPLPDTQRGRDAAVSVRNGTLTGLSVEFKAQRESHRDGLRVVEAARLTGAGLVDSASYRTSVEVRQREAQDRRRKARAAWL